jgi:proteasome lid subunit RPN8/RPN11
VNAVILPAAVRDAIVSHAREAAPAECCGMLIGSAGRIGSAIRARNIAAEPTRFLIHPADHIRARREARDAGLDVVGFYHSHPHSTPVPSDTDLAEASYPNHFYVIVGLKDEAADVRVYRFTGAAFQLQIADPGADFDHHRR